MHGVNVIQGRRGSAGGEGNAHGASGAARGTTPVDWKRAHEELVRLTADQAKLDWEVGGSLLRALRSAAHVQLGYASFAEYVNRLFGYEPRFTSEKLRVAEALEELPQLTRALREGELCWSVVREITRVATPTTETVWLEVARGRTSREAERMVSGRRSGDRPDDPADASLIQHVLRFEVRAETRALMREALAKLRRDAGGRLDDDAALRLMARQVLGGSKDEGRSSYQVGLTVCDECRRGWQHGSGELVEVGAEVVERAHCDAQHIGMTHAGPSERDAQQIGMTHAGPSEFPARAQCDAQHVAMTHAGRSDSPRKPERAAQSIPPAIRRSVARRDAGRCQVPGCRHAHFVDLHHLELRSEGGVARGGRNACCSGSRQARRDRLGGWRRAVVTPTELTSPRGKLGGIVAARAGHGACSTRALSA